MTEIVKNENICVEPRFLDDNLTNHVLNILRKNQDANQCTKELGYILKVSNVGDIIGAEVSPASAEIIVTVPVTMTVFKPIVGEEHIGEVCDVTANGLFVSVYERQKVLIQRSSMSEYEFDPVWDAYRFGDKMIKKNDQLILRITGAKYTKQRYACYATLVGLKDSESTTK